MQEMPRIRVEVEGLGERISSMLMLHAEEISAQVKQGVNNALDRIDIVEVAEGHARQAVVKAIEEGVRNYFAYGEGSRTLKAVLAEMMDHDDVRAEIKRRVLAQLERE